MRDRFVKALNVARVAHGHGRVKRSPRLEALAQRQAEQMAADRDIHHHHAATRFARTGFGNWNESVLMHTGKTGAARVLRAWMASYGHRLNLMAGQMRYVGIGVARRGDRVYWCAALAR